MKTIKYALVGPPNVGKSMIFYRLVGRRVKIANYPGKTLDKEIGSFEIGDTTIEISDLPGIFNVENPKDEDEILALSDAFNGNYQGIVVIGAPHVMKESLNILRIMAKKKKVIFVLNMVDLANPAIDEETLSSKLGVPVVYASAAKGVGIQKLKELLASDKGIKTDVPEINVEFKGNIWKAKLLSRPSVAIPTLLGILLLTLMVLLIFVDGTTPFGDSPFALIPAIEPALDWVAGLLVIPGNPLLTLFLKNGIWSGVSVVILFIPYVAAVSFSMALYEQTGLIGALSSGVEKISSKFGFSPRSIVIAFMGASCNIPSMTATKVLWGKRSRTLTALLIPYIPCAPRMTLFIMIASVVLPSYLVPIAFLVPYFATIIAILLGFIIYHSIVGHPSEVEKLPPTPIMMPNWRIVGLRTWDYLADFLKKLSLLIIATTILLWLPSILGPGGITYDVTDSWLGVAGKFLEPVFAPIGIPWQVSVSLMGGWIFKEVVIGILAEFGGLSLIGSLSVASALALMVFLAFYSSCIATLTALAKRVGLALTLVSIAVQLILAVIFAYITYVVVSIL
ncbi:MAG: FeoB small GTPase domain-containing protein [Thermoplasmata archaeon]|jgi:ferrous iron transport protein B|nr:MAG: ferrous iron transporter B [Aciduliprofundum sp.]